MASAEKIGLTDFANPPLCRDILLPASPPSEPARRALRRKSYPSDAGTFADHPLAISHHSDSLPHSAEARDPPIQRRWWHFGHPSYRASVRVLSLHYEITSTEARETYEHHFLHPSYQYPSVGPCLKDARQKATGLSVPKEHQSQSLSPTRFPAIAITSPWVTGSRDGRNKTTWADGAPTMPVLKQLVFALTVSSVRRGHRASPQTNPRGHV